MSARENTFAPSQQPAAPSSRGEEVSRLPWAQVIAGSNPADSTHPAWVMGVPKGQRPSPGLQPGDFGGGEKRFPREPHKLETSGSIPVSAPGTGTNGARLVPQSPAGGRDSSGTAAFVPDTDHRRQ